MPRGLRGKLFRCNALPHRTQPAARISSAIFSSVRTRNSTNLESSRVVWHIRGVSLVLGTQERQVYPRGSQDSRGRPPSLPQPIRWGPRKSPFRKVLRNIIDVDLRSYLERDSYYTQAYEGCAKRSD